VNRSYKGAIRQAAYFTFSAAVTVGVFTYLLSHVPLSEIARILRSADRRGIAMFIILSMAMSVFRTWRYLLVLQVAGQRPPVTALFLVVLVRNFFSDLLPARLGTLIYIYITVSRLGIPFSAATSSYALAVLFDFIALAPMIALAALGVAASNELSPGMLLAAGSLLAVLTLMVLIALPRLFHLVRWTLERLVRLTHGRFATWRDAWARAEEDIIRARRAGIYLRMFILSVLVRVGKYGALYFFLYALARPMGYALKQLSVARVFIGLCASELAASTPVSGIAGFGAYEGAWALVFRLLGFPRHFAEVTSISHHLFTQAYGYSLGALALLLLLLPVFRRRPQSPPGPRPHPGRPDLFYLYLAGFLLLLAAAIAALFLH